MAGAPVSVWRETVRLGELARGRVHRRLEPDSAQLAGLAGQLGLGSLESLTAEVTVSSWLDGAEVDGRFTAQVTQICGVTLDPFEATVSGDFRVRVVPPGSPNIPANEEGDEMELDLDADDPPDVLEGEEIDIAHYVTEHLALEIDPFPRKPDAVFEPPAPEEEASPFAVLRKLRQDDSPK